MTNELKRIGDLEINEDLGYQRHYWTAQRVGWVVITAVVIAALLGLFGPGLFSRAAVGNREAPISVEEYERFVRFGKPTTLRVRIGEGSATRHEARLWVSRQYIESVQLQGVTPEPESVQAGQRRLTYVFETQTAPGQPTAVTFDLMPDKIGSLKGKVGLESGPSLNFNQFAYP